MDFLYYQVNRNLVKKLNQLYKKDPKNFSKNFPFFTLFFNYKNTQTLEQLFSLNENQQMKYNVEFTNAFKKEIKKIHKLFSFGDNYKTQLLEQQQTKPNFSNCPVNRNNSCYANSALWAILFEDNACSRWFLNLPEDPNWNKKKQSQRQSSQRQSSQGQSSQGQSSQGQSSQEQSSQRQSSQGQSSQVQGFSKMKKDCPKDAPFQLRKLMQNFAYAAQKKNNFTFCKSHEKYDRECLSQKACVVPIRNILKKCDFNQHEPDKWTKNMMDSQEFLQIILKFYNIEGTNSPKEKINIILENMMRVGRKTLILKLLGKQTRWDLKYEEKQETKPILIINFPNDDVKTEMEIDDKKNRIKYTSIIFTEDKFKYLFRNKKYLGDDKSRRKETIIYEFSDFAILFINRTGYDKDKHENLKISSAFIFPDSIGEDLTLRSIVVHEGTGLDGGHYVCYFKKNKKWYLMNDASGGEISEINFETNLENIQQNCQLLVYAKTDQKKSK